MIDIGFADAPLSGNRGYEAQDYLESGEDLVEGVPMPQGLIARVQAPVDRHPIDEPLRKRGRNRVDTEAPTSGRSRGRADGPYARTRGRNRGA